MSWAESPYLSYPFSRTYGSIYKKVFVLLIPIPRCCAFSPMPPIGTSGVGLACNTEPIGGVTFRSILKSTIEASEATSIEDTRQKELLVHLTFPKRGFPLLILFSLCEPPFFLVRLRCK